LQLPRRGRQVVRMMMAGAAQGVPGVMDAAGQLRLGVVLAQADELLQGRQRRERDLASRPVIVDRPLQRLPSEQRGPRAATSPPSPARPGPGAGGPSTGGPGGARSAGAVTACPAATARASRPRG
jgi:hypothetical protein